MLAGLGRRIVVVVALVVASSVIVAPARAVPTGYLVVSVVDQHGAAVPAGMLVMDDEERVVVESNEPVSALRALSLPSGTYGVAALAPFGGLVCRGLTPCDVSAMMGVDPAAGLPVGTETTEVTLTVTMPTISGIGHVGAPLTLSVPPQLAALEDAIVGASQNTPTTYSGILQIVWLRDGVPTGSVGTTYVPSSDDVGHAIGARISRDAVGTAMMGQILTGAATHYETPTVLVSAPVAPTPTTPAAPTTTTTPAPAAPAALARASITASLKRRPRPSVLVRVTAPGSKPAGSVTLSVAGWRRDAQLLGGSVRVPLGDFRPGTYRVRVEYAGSATVAAGVMTKKLTIRADGGKRHPKR